MITPCRFDATTWRMINVSQIFLFLVGFRQRLRNRTMAKWHGILALESPPPDKRKSVYLNFSLSFSFVCFDLLLRAKVRVRVRYTGHVNSPRRRINLLARSVRIIIAIAWFFFVFFFFVPHPQLFSVSFLLHVLQGIRHALTFCLVGSMAGAKRGVFKAG